jgi:hypothetical protein
MTNDGPSLETYIETRFNLLSKAVEDSAASQASALGASIEAAKSALAAVNAAAAAALAAADIRYQQRFEAQSDALQAAFLSQQTAMKTALDAAKEAVNAALAAADRAVLKAELAADKRFEALNELRQMLNDTLVKLLPRTEATQQFNALDEKIQAANHRVDLVEGRSNIAAGETTGNRRMKDDTRLYLGLGISVVLVLIAIASFIFARMAPP